MKKTNYGILQGMKMILLGIVGALVIAVLLLATLSRNTVTRSRPEGDYIVVQDASMLRLSGAERISECRFTLGHIEHAETLAFYVNHHEVQVYVGDECVYTLTAAPDNFVTVGGAWITIPLYQGDTGKLVRVVLTPLYDNYQTEMPEFLLGSEVAVHNATLHRALPAMILSFCVIFAGFMLVCLAIWHSIKGIFAGRLYALGFMAICAGLWRISYDRVAYLLLEGREVFVYSVSVISLMGMAVSMLNSLPSDEKGRKAIHICTCCYCAVYIVQLVLQILGIADLRETLKLIHATIVISAAAFLVSAIRQWSDPRHKRRERGNYGWILGVGVVVDLLLYYFSYQSFTIVFSLIAILCYTVLEGIELLFTYIEQKNALEEMKMQLTLSRTTTMMSQIRSHFVFNVLNAISGMCKYDPEMADETVVRFARYLRNNIDIMEKDGNIPFATDLRQLEDYVALEQVRFGSKLEFYTDIECDNFKIPPLILQPVVENAIKHGISKKEGDGNIILRTREEGGKIVITVEDDGVGFDTTQPEKAQSVGLRNIRFRLEHLVHGELDIQSELGKGTLVTITIPKEGN